MGLIGGSGSGKTTLLTCLNGYRKSFDGSVILNGIPSNEKNKIRHLIGYVPQDDIVHKTLTVERALYYSYLLRLDNQTADEKIDAKVDKILHQLDLKDHKNKKIKSLSGGQRKRVNQIVFSKFVLPESTLKGVALKIEKLMVVKWGFEALRVCKKGEFVYGDYLFSMLILICLGLLFLSLTLFHLWYAGEET